MKRRNIIFWLTLSFFSGSLLADEPINNTPVKVILETAHDVSEPLSDMAQSTIQSTFHVTPLRRVPLKLEPSRGILYDEAIQPTVGLLLNTTPGLSFLGLGGSFPGFTINSYPPDTNASVGLTQVVQWVNTSYAIFNKGTGQLILGPTHGNALWAGFGGSCEVDNDGDPIVKYDRIANRWVMTQFAFAVDGNRNPVPPYYQCVAVSKTSNAAGAYNRYSFSFGSDFNDYGKLGVWPDAYYMSFNMFPPGFAPDLTAVPTHYGPSACALDRASMLAGTAATMQCFQPQPAAGIFLPADLDGAALPPVGSPNYFVGLLQNAQGVTSQTNVALWKFHVDWQHPNNSSFSGPVALKVASFNPIICNNDPGADCAVQPQTSQKLEVLADRLMYRLAYRNFGLYQSMVVNHNVQVGNSVPGTRWYEIRVNNQGTATVYQQGTYSQLDSNGRWMGSIAMDKLGNMALGYSISSATIFPSIRYTGRNVTDPINTMRTEKTIVTGQGSQLAIPGDSNRWGDYSSMAIDPSDDCTFWYTTEYVKTTGIAHWSTWIASFKFPTCH